MDGNDRGAGCGVWCLARMDGGGLEAHSIVHGQDLIGGDHELSDLDTTGGTPRDGLGRTAEQVRDGLGRTAEQVRDGLGRTAEENPRAGIAISALKPRDLDCGRFPADYVSAVRRAGGDPFVLSVVPMCPEPTGSNDVEVLEVVAPDDTSALENARGLLLTGGGDVDPSLYGQKPHPRTYNVTPVRDRFERNLLDLALERDMPVLAICRGMQLLNVHLGGTLEQHLPEVPGRLEHDRDRPRAETAHEISIAAGSVLGAWLGDRAPVNSHHHQGLGVVASGLEEVAHARDGVVEGVVSRDRTWVVGVQWHPEAMVPVYERQLGVFSAFVAATERYARLVPVGPQRRSSG
jgi:putative glutamine amidotransferase